MDFDGEYGASTWDWVAEQVEAYEGSNGAKAATLRDTGMPIIIITTCLLYTSDAADDY